MLKAIAELLRQSLRRPDVLCRWGGEEFLILLRGTIVREAVQIAERLRQKVESHIFSSFEHVRDITVSIGGCGLPPNRTIERLIEVADTALYIAKGNGRNQVKVSEEIHP